jgi:hypothetical protein
MKFNGLYSRGLMAGVSIVILLKWANSTSYI